MGYAELIAKLRALPDDKQAEVFDFVEFLSLRAAHEGQDLAKSEWTSADFAAFSMSQAMRGLEHDPAVYSLEDLKERWS